MRRMRRKRTGVKRRLPNKTIYHFYSKPSRKKRRRRRTTKKSMMFINEFPFDSNASKMKTKEDDKEYPYDSKASRTSRKRRTRRFLNKSKCFF